MTIHRSAFRSRTLSILGVVALAACGAPVAPEEPSDPEVRLVEGVTTDVAAIIGTFATGPMRRPFLIQSQTEFDRFYGGVHPLHEASYHVRAFFQNGGREIWISRAESATEAALIGSPGGSGLWALDEANRFDLLLVPELFSAPEVTDRAFAASMAITYAASRNAMFLLDPPAEVASPHEMIGWINESSASPRSRHAALFFGRISVRENADAGTSRWIGASGAAAGIFSWNDRERGVWEAPAGPNVPALIGVLDADPLSDADREALNVEHIIALQRAPVRIWGARTLLTGSSPFTFLNVQRLTLYIEARVREALAWAPGQVMEPEVWDRAQSDAEEVLEELWREGAFQGMQPRDGYYARSDVTLHSPGDISAGRLNVQVGFAPLKPAEFIVRMITVQL